jgi:hypothetical protein
MIQDQLDIGKELESSIREYRRNLGNSNQELNKSINLLSQINDLRDTSIAKVKALNKESINTREIQKEYKKAREKEELTLTKLDRLSSTIGATEKQEADDYVKNLGLRAKKEEEIRRARLQGNTTQYAALSRELQILEHAIDYGDKYFTIEQMQYAAALQSNKVAEENVNFLKEELELEKELRSEVGFTGLALGKISEKLGFGTKAYERMVEKARDLKDENEKISFGDKLKAVTSTIGEIISETFKDPLLLAAALVGAYKLVEKGLTMVGNAAAKAGNLLAGMSEDSSNIVRGLVSNVSNLARNIPLIGGLVGGLIDGFAAVLDLVIGVDNMIVKTGRQLNLSAEAARGLYRQFASMSQASGDVYMNGKKYLESQLELSKQLGITNILNQEILKTNVQLRDFAGLELDTRAKIVESAKITGKTSQDTVKSVLSQVVGLRRATGVSFQYQQVLKEVSSLGGYLGLQFAKYPKELTKTYLATKTLGLELKQLDGMASSFLDFESSISKEFEAQLLTGKDINLNKARELFLNNDLAGAAAEIAKYTGDAAGYSKMNRIQQDSFAEALGMSRDQMADMLKQQELYSKFQVKNREDLLKQVDLLRKSGNAQEAINKAGSVAAYNDLVRASAQEKLAMFIEKIKQSIVEFIENTNFIEKVEKFINMLSNPDTIKGILGKIRDVISTFIEIVGEVLADVIEVGGEIANFFTFGKKGDEREAKAYEFAAKVREGSLEMSKRVAGFGVENKPVSVGENAAKEKAGVNKNVSEDNMKMA